MVMRCLYEEMLNGQRRYISAPKNKKVDDNVLLSIKESVGDANNPI